MPKLLDLFCKAGGCSYGYSLAGFDVTGVDIEPQPNYPFKFVQADALTFDLSGYDVIHASPPCQFATRLQAIWANKHEHTNLIGATRERLKAAGVPYVIENVSTAKKYMIDPIMLCGTMFDLRVIRHRLFESNVHLFVPPHCDACRQRKIKCAQPGVYPTEEEYWCITGHIGHKEEAQRAIGIDWMKNRNEIVNAIPPAYTQFLGQQLMEYVLNASMEQSA